MNAGTFWLLFRAIPKTLWFNFHYFPIRTAVRLPVLVSHRVWLMKMSGTVRVNQPKPRIIKLGFGEVGIFDKQRSRTIWQVSGTVEFCGQANIGHGSKLSVAGVLSLGDNFMITAESSIICSKEISFGKDVLISWDVLIMDRDFHPIFDAENKCINEAQAIAFGDRVWLGCRSMVLKGVSLPSDTVVAAGATISKPVSEGHTIVGNSPQRVLKTNITWSAFPQV